jgi:hypothetical protein
VKRRFSRRELLATGALGTATGRSGCSALRPNGGRLGAVAVANQGSEPRDVRVRVERDGQAVRDSTVSLGTETVEDFALVDCTWDSAARGAVRFGSELKGAGERHVTTSDHLARRNCDVANVICLRGTLTSARDERAEVEEYPDPLCTE